MIKILQYGEGNFLRAFADVYFHALNLEGADYGVYAVKPTPSNRSGMMKLFEKQENKYHTVLRGSENGAIVESVCRVESLKGVINPFEDHGAYLALAKDPELKLIVSNTTEAGICYDPSDGIGGFADVTLARLAPAGGIILLSLLLVLTLSQQMDVLALGAETAQSLGLSVRPVRLMLLVLAAALCGAAISFAGLLGFVGLIVPHMMRKLVGEESLKLTLGCAMGGAALVAVCDTLARVVFAPYELPVGIVLSFAGVPFFLWLLLRQRGGRISD
jgi:hypothetical protein